MNEVEGDLNTHITLPFAQGSAFSSQTAQETIWKQSLGGTTVTSAGRRQITRNRASYSCHTCRRRKVKCDKVHPVCGNCLKNATECIYNTTSNSDANVQGRDEEARGHGVKRRRGLSRPLEGDIDESSSFGSFREDRSNHAGAHEQRRGSLAIQARLDKLKSMVDRLSRVNGPLRTGEQDTQLRMTNSDLGVAIRGSQAMSVSNVTMRDEHKEMLSSHSGQASPRRIAESNSDEFPIPSGDSTDLVDPIGSLNIGHLSLEDGGKSRYVGTTYWAYISEEINELNRLLREQDRSHDVLTPDEGSEEESSADQGRKTPTGIWNSIESGNSRYNRRKANRGHNFQASVLVRGDSPPMYEKVVIVEPEMLDHVPSKAQSDSLYKGFMSGVHAISPVLHPPTILKSYHAFWDWYDRGSYSGEQCPDPSFLPLLYAIWYGGSATISIRIIIAEFQVSSRAVLSELYNDQVTRWLTQISFPKSPSLHGLAAFLIVQTILSKEEEPLTSSLFISRALRVAQMMGLHRDPAQFGITSFEAESRRRVWWHIVHMDGVVAMSSGLPPLVSDENYWDVRETSEVKDTLLGTPQADQYERLVIANLRPPDNPDDPTICGGPSMVNVHYLSARGKYIMARAIRKILKIQLGTRPITRKDMEDLRTILVDLQIKLNAIINRIPLAQHPRMPSKLGQSAPSDPAQSAPFVSMNPGLDGSTLPGDMSSDGCSEQYHSPVLVAFHKWARILLSLFIDKAFCVAYQPFLKNAKSRIWPAARQGALRHCHGFMDKFIHLATDPDFQPFQWSWPGNHQPMHATMIMLIDLYERPNSPEASRSRAFIDKVFSLSGPDGGVVGGEDGITRQRPLKDGGREAWDMMRRLREKAWQKAGLDPQQLWTEHAQIQAGVSPATDMCYQETESGFDGYYPFTLSRPEGQRTDYVDTRMAERPKPDPQLADFSNKFYDLTRTHILPNPVGSSVRPELPRFHYKSPHPFLSTVSETPPHAAPFLNSFLDSSLSSPAVGSPESIAYSSSVTSQPNTHSVPLTATPLSTTSLHPEFQPVPYNDQILVTGAAADFDTDTNTKILTTVAPSSSTTPSMLDPNFAFDWDQWDAVFGQQPSVADEFTEFDTVAEVGFPDFGGGIGLGGGNVQSGGNQAEDMGDLQSWSDFRQ